MRGRTRRNGTPAFATKAVLAAIEGEKTLADLDRPGISGSAVAAS